MDPLLKPNLNWPILRSMFLQLSDAILANHETIASINLLIIDKKQVPSNKGFRYCDCIDVIMEKYC